MYGGECDELAGAAAGVPGVALLGIADRPLAGPLPLPLPSAPLFRVDRFGVSVALDPGSTWMKDGSFVDLALGARFGDMAGDSARAGCSMPIPTELAIDLPRTGEFVPRLKSLTLADVVGSTFEEVLLLFWFEEF